MKANYHYYTVKTLAHYAGFDEETAQFIAYFSQFIDEFILSQPFVVEDKPPGFFLERGLARELDDHRWIFSPCPTGVSMSRSTSHNYQLHTLMPFHFIMPQAKSELPENPDRSVYRCAAANTGDGLLINRLMKETVGASDVNDRSSLMALGMLLHTFADTYSHCGFSGFHGWENQSYASRLMYKCPYKQESFLLKRVREWIKVKLTGRQIEYNSLNVPLHTLYSTLPSIGHANVGMVVDCCESEIAFYNKETHDGKMKTWARRDNSEYFDDCSRRIMQILCGVTRKSLPDDEEWEGIRSKLSRAQMVSDQGNHTKNRIRWNRVFPHIKYHYKKNALIDIKLAPLTRQREALRELRKEPSLDIDFNRRDVSNIYSDKGEQARAALTMIAKNVSDLFYMFNEHAYRHVFHTTGEYASAGDFAQMSNRHKLASAINDE